jgi:hypothetical protein
VGTQGLLELQGTDTLPSLQLDGGHRHMFDLCSLALKHMLQCFIFIEYIIKIILRILHFT